MGLRIAQRLAAEVVELEEKALKAKSEELKREREAAAEREAARRAQAAAKAAQQERETLQSILDTLEVGKLWCLALILHHSKVQCTMAGSHLIALILPELTTIHQQAHDRWSRQARSRRYQQSLCDASMASCVCRTRRGCCMSSSDERCWESTSGRSRAARRPARRQTSCRMRPGRPRHFAPKRAPRRRASERTASCRASPGCASMAALYATAPSCIMDECGDVLPVLTETPPLGLARVSKSGCSVAAT